MSILSKLGNIVGDVTGIFPLISKVVDAMELLFGPATGANKLTAAVEAALAAMQIYATSTGKILPASFKDDLQAAINSVVLLKNDLGELLPHSGTLAADSK